MKVCPSCGKSDVAFVGSFCVDCMAKKPLVELNPKGLEVIYCPKCERVRSGSAWVAFNQAVVDELVMRKLKSPYNFSASVSYVQHKDFLAADATLVFDVDGTPLKQEKHFGIPFLKTLCIDCSRAAGGYKEAIVQIRGEDRAVERVLRILERRLEGNTFWKTEGKKTGGVDLIAGSRNVVLDAVRGLKKPFSLTRKLAGVRQGKKIFLVTILIKLGD